MLKEATAAQVWEAGTGAGDGDMLQGPGTDGQKPRLSEESGLQPQVREQLACVAFGIFQGLRP